MLSLLFSVSRQRDVSCNITKMERMQGIVTMNSPLTQPTILIDQYIKMLCAKYFFFHQLRTLLQENYKKKTKLHNKQVIKRDKNSCLCVCVFILFSGVLLDRKNNDKDQTLACYNHIGLLVTQTCLSMFRSSNTGDLNRYSILTLCLEQFYRLLSCTDLSTLYRETKRPSDDATGSEKGL